MSQLNAALHHYKRAAAHAESTTHAVVSVPPHVRQQVVLARELAGAEVTAEGLHMAVLRLEVPHQILLVGELSGAEEALDH